MAKRWYLHIDLIKSTQSAYDFRWSLKPFKDHAREMYVHPDVSVWVSKHSLIEGFPFLPMNTEVCRKLSADGHKLVDLAYAPKLRVRVKKEKPPTEDVGGRIQRKLF